MKQLFCLLILFTSFYTAKADSLWIEADATGKVGVQQTLKVIFGSYNQYKLQKVDGEFEEVKDFTCWAISPTGKHIELSFLPKETSYEADFIPTEEGIYAILLENKLRKVEDWSKSTTKIGVTKQHYYARTEIRIGNSKCLDTKPYTDLAIVQNPTGQSGRDLSLLVLLHGKPVANATLFMRHPNMVEQKLQTDAEGKVTFHAPRSGRYFSLVTLRFETPGTYKGITFDVFREKATLITVID